ncbi:MAG: UbiA family prenyltransferase [Bacteroidota bacterium]
MSTEIKLKPLYLFFVAANSLLLAGNILINTVNIPQLILLQWCGISGIFLIYRFNDFIDQTHDFKFNIRRFLSIKLHIIILGQLFLITLPAAFYLLSAFHILILIIICILGILYSLTFPYNGRNYRVKNIFLVKNIFIGFAWGSLILVGAGVFANDLISGLFIFTSIQVTIGSIIRDIPDIARDKTDNVKSLPVIFGTEKTLNLLHILNALSLLAGCLMEKSNAFLLLMLITISWRAFSLVKIQNNHHSRLWTQTFNLLTCFLILVIILVQYIYELN